MVQEDALARKTLGKAHSINQQTDGDINKREPRGDDPMQQKQHDPWHKERLQLQDELTTKNDELNNKNYEIDKLNERVAKLEAAQVAKLPVAQTPMMKERETEKKENTNTHTHTHTHSRATPRELVTANPTGAYPTDRRES